MLEKYKSYTEEIAPKGDDNSQYDEYSTAVNLLAGGIAIIQSSRNSFQGLVDKLQREFDESKAKGSKKGLIAEVEDIDSECQFTERIAKANEMIYVLEARLTESRNKMSKLAQKLGIAPRKNQTTSVKNLEVSLSEKDNVHPKSGGRGESEQEAVSDPDSAWISEDFSENNSGISEDTLCRTLKPKQLQLPKFYGDEGEFPEF